MRRLLEFFRRLRRREAIAISDGHRTFTGWQAAMIIQRQSSRSSKEWYP